MFGQRSSFNEQPVAPAAAPPPQEEVVPAPAPVPSDAPPPEPDTGLATTQAVEDVAPAGPKRTRGNSRYRQ